MWVSTYQSAVKATELILKNQIYFLCASCGHFPSTLLSKNQKLRMLRYFDLRFGFKLLNVSLIRGHLQIYYFQYVNYLCIKYSVDSPLLEYSGYQWRNLPHNHLYRNMNSCEIGLAKVDKEYAGFSTILIKLAFKDKQSSFYMNMRDLDKASVSDNKIL